MNEIILAVLSVLLADQGGLPLPSRFVPFDQMPKICASAFNDDLRHVLNAHGAHGTNVAEIDFDKDGCAEKLVFNGRSGSGGEGWTIFRKDQSEWQKIGDVFGILSVVKFKTHNGLLVYKPCGWTYAACEFYDLINGNFTKRLKLSLYYSKPIRKMPKRIEIRMSDRE